MFSSKFLLSTVTAALLAGSATAFTGTGTHIILAADRWRANVYAT
jgi:hypothetical protein